MLRGADRARPVARLGRRARAHRYDNPKFVPVTSSTTRRATTPSARCCSPRPSPSRSGRRTTSAGSSATARPSASAASAARRPRSSAQPAAGRRCLLTSPELSARRIHRVGSDPRPHAHARRSAVRPVHDPSAQPLLDVLARGAPLRPDGVRRGGEAGAEGFAFARYVQYAILFDRLFRFPVTGSRVRNYDGLGGQLLFAFLHREGYLHWTDNRLTIEWERLAEGVGALRERVRTSTTRASTARSSRSGRRARPGRRRTSGRRRLALGEGQARPARGRPSRRSSSTWSRRTSSRSPSSTSSSSRSSRRSWRVRRTPCRKFGKISVVSALDGQMVAIAGATGGLGPSVARRLADGGATIAGVDTHQEQLDSLRAELDLPDDRFDGQVVDLLDGRRKRSGRAICRAIRRSRCPPAPGRRLERRPAARRGAPDDYEWLHDLLVRTLQHTSRAFHDDLAASDPGGSCSFLHAGAEARGHERLLRRDQGGRRKVDAGPRRFVKDPRRPPTWSSSTRS